MRDQEAILVRFALLGCGRIGKMHAANLAAHPRAQLTTVYDIHTDAAREVAEAHGCRLAGEVDEALGREDIDAVLIASSTDTHCELIITSAHAGKAILCEKPIDLSSDRVDACWQEIAALQPRIMIGFNRRFDPSFAEVQARIARGEIGDLRQLIITSRDPEVPPISYMKVAGGLLRDMTIHDFDLARFLLAEEPKKISCFAGAVISDEVKALGDLDSAMILLETESGRMCCVNNYRQAVYGYDQRIEAIGATGMLLADNRRATTVQRYDAKVTAARDPLLYFFIERYREAYRRELDEFIEAILEDRSPSVGFEDGLRALRLADAAYRSLETDRVVTLD